MSQYNFGNLSSPLPGSVLVDTHLEPWRDALHSMHSGTSRPSYAVSGTLWMDISGSPYIMKVFDGTDDITIGTLNTSTNIFTPNLNGITIATATVAINDKVVIQDTSDSNNLKTVTAQSIADLAAAGAQFKVGTTVHNLASATGTIVITGVGFQPKVVDLFMNLDSSDNFSMGFADASLGRCVTRHAGNFFAGASLGSIYPGGVSNRVDFDVSSFDADGFTIAYTKFGSPSGTVGISYKVAR